MSEPVFVEKSWVEKVDAELKNDAPKPSPAPPPSSRFYDVRPAVLRTGWAWSGDELCWSCKMSFLVNGQPATARYTVYAPTFPQTQMPPVNNYSGNPRVFVVWRGRWEVVATPPAAYTAGSGINITSTNVVENTGVLNVNGVASSVVLDTRTFEAAPNWPNCFCLKHSSELRGVGAITVTDRTNNNIAPGSVAPESYQQISFDGLPVTIGGSEPAGPYKGAFAVAFYSSSGSALPASTVTVSQARFLDTTGELAFSTSTLYTKTIEVVTNAVYNQSTGLIGLTKETITYLSLTP